MAAGGFALRMLASPRVPHAATKSYAKPPQAVLLADRLGMTRLCNLWNSRDGFAATGFAATGFAASPSATHNQQP